MTSDLEKELEESDSSLANILKCIGAVVIETSELLRTSGAVEVGTTNLFGDKQLKVDMEVDELIWQRLRESGLVEVACSEERPEAVELGGKGFSVAFDPLDGSSILAANFAVGSIFGVWPGHGITGKCGRDMVAAAYAVYGPRTLFVIARTLANGSKLVQEFVLLPSSPTAPPRWALHRANVNLGSAQIFAPSNLRCCVDNTVYRDLVGSWMASGLTLRYSGGMVPDVHHMLAKGGGVFVCPSSHAAPGKLRLAYECAPLAFVVEAAGGASHDGQSSLLDKVITSLSQRSVVALGSVDLVQQCQPSLAEVT